LNRLCYECRLVEHCGIPCVHVISVHQFARNPLDWMKPPKSLGMCHSKTFTMRYCISPNLSVRRQPRIPSGRVLRCSLSGRCTIECTDNVTNIPTSHGFNQRRDNQMQP
jgi:hypothetical protein